MPDPTIASSTSSSNAHPGGNVQEESQGPTHETDLPAHFSAGSIVETGYIPLGPLSLDDSEDLELSSRRTTEVNPPTVAFEYLAAGARIDAALLHVKYGKFNGDQAALIAFQYTFISRKEARTISADITVKFVQTDDPSIPSKYPKVVHCYPGPQDGAPTDCTIHDAIHGDVTLESAPVKAASMNLGVSRDKSFTLMHRSTVRSGIRSHSDSAKGRQCRNTVVWILEENETQKRGVGPIFNCAVIVQLPSSSEHNHGLPFYADFTIRPTQTCNIRQMGTSLFRKSRDKELVCFDFKTAFRADRLSDELETIDLHELLKLPTIDALPPGY